MQGLCDRQLATRHQWYLHCCPTDIHPPTLVLCGSDAQVPGPGVGNLWLLREWWHHACGCCYCEGLSIWISTDPGAAWTQQISAACGTVGFQTLPLVWWHQACGSYFLGNCVNIHRFWCHTDRTDRYRQGRGRCFRWLPPNDGVKLVAARYGGCTICTSTESAATWTQLEIVVSGFVERWHQACGCC